MFTWRQSPEPSNLDRAIDSVYRDMDSMTSDSPEYRKMREQVTELEKLRADLRPKRPSPDTVLTVVGHILGIGMVVGHERFNVITSNAKMFWRKLG